jgi:hypothetical protein
MDEKRREQYTDVFNCILSDVEVMAKCPPSAHVLAKIVAVCDAVVEGNESYVEALTKEIEPIAQECLDRRAAPH